MWREYTKHIPDQGLRTLLTSPDHSSQKAALKNLRVSGEAKERSRQVLDTELKVYGKSDESHEERVIAAHKVLMQIPRVSDAPKEKARHVLQEHGIQV
ncbi:hypothetical protein ACEPAI_750 [Sanghuangporus weigelae]